MKTYVCGKNKRPLASCYYNCHVLQTLDSWYRYFKIYCDEKMFVKMVILNI